MCPAPTPSSVHRNLTQAGPVSSGRAVDGDQEHGYALPIPEASTRSATRWDEDRLRWVGSARQCPQFPTGSNMCAIMGTHACYADVIGKVRLGLIDARRPDSSG